jgi:hypothetical protein
LTFRRRSRRNGDDAGAFCGRRSRLYVRICGARSRPITRVSAARRIARGDVYVAVDDSAIVGVAATDGATAASTSTGWASIRRARHRARQLAAGATRGDDRAGEWLKGLSLMTAEMAEGNIRLYRRHGFEIVGRGRHHHGQDPHIGSTW